MEVLITTDKITGGFSSELNALVNPPVFLYL